MFVFAVGCSPKELGGGGVFSVINCSLTSGGLKERAFGVTTTAAVAPTATTATTATANGKRKGGKPATASNVQMMAQQEVETYDVVLF